MAWTRISKVTPIVDSSLGFVGAWNLTAFKWNELTTSYWSRVWTKETKSVSSWTKES